MSNIITRMGEVLPTVYRGAGQWLAVSRKYAPLGKAIAEQFGESVNAHAFGHWLKAHAGKSIDGVTLTGRHNKHKKQWQYHCGEMPPPVGDYIPRAPEPVYDGPAIPVPALMTDAEREAARVAHRDAVLRAMAPKPKPVAPPRTVARFTNANVVEGPSGSIIRRPEPFVDVSMNPYPAPTPPRPVPYIPKLPADVIVTRVPEPRRPGVNYGADGTQTPRDGHQGWNVFNP